MVYLDNNLLQDPVSLELYAEADAWIDSESEGGAGTDVSLSLNLYDSSGGGRVDRAPQVTGDGGGQATAYTTIQTPKYPGDQYTSDAYTVASVYDVEDTDQDETAYADLQVTQNTLGSCIPIPSVSGAIMVDGVPTNGFVLPASGVKTGTLTISGGCMLGVTGISFADPYGNPWGLTATVTQTTTTSVTASYSLSSTATVGWGAVQASTPTESGGVPLTGGPLPTDFSENSNTFYWVDAANARQVRYEVTLSDGQILDSYALFNVGGPVAPVVSVVSGSVVTDQNILVNPSTGQPYYDPSGTQVLVYEGVSKLPLAGNPTPTFPSPYTAGITISGSVTQPPGVAGKMVFVQLLDSYNVVLSAPGLQNGGCLFAGLDGGFPYGAVGPSSGPTTYMYDSPKVSLVAPTTYASAIFSAHAYVMWQPSLPSSIPVPLGYVRWGLSGYAENNGAAWVLDTSDPVNKPNAGYASDFQVGNTYPNWSSFVPPQPSCAKPN